MPVAVTVQKLYVTLAAEAKQPRYPCHIAIVCIQPTHPPTHNTAANTHPILLLQQAWLSHPAVPQCHTEHNVPRVYTHPATVIMSHKHSTPSAGPVSYSPLPNRPPSDTHPFAWVAAVFRSPLPLNTTQHASHPQGVRPHGSCPTATVWKLGSTSLHLCCKAQQLPQHKPPGGFRVLGFGQP
jgi:hypothetical protein